MNSLKITILGVYHIKSGVSLAVGEFSEKLKYYNAELHNINGMKYFSSCR